MTDWSELSYATRRAKVETLAVAALRHTTGPIGTSALAALVAADASAPVRAVETILGKLAPSFPQARHDGATFKSYGRVMRRWNWYPVCPVMPRLGVMITEDEHKEFKRLRAMAEKKELGTQPASGVVWSEDQLDELTAPEGAEGLEDLL